LTKTKNKKKSGVFHLLSSHHFSIIFSTTKKEKKRARNNNGLSHKYTYIVCYLSKDDDIISSNIFVYSSPKKINLSSDMYVSSGKEGEQQNSQTPSLKKKRRKRKRKISQEMGSISTSPRAALSSFAALAAFALRSLAWYSL